MRCVDVAINLPVKGLFRQYTYMVPEGLSFIRPGWRVIVPFGTQKTEGFVVSESAACCAVENSLKLKYIEAALGDRPWFDEKMLAAAQWISEYYLCSLAEAMRLFIPGKTTVNRKVVKTGDGKLSHYECEERLKERSVTAYIITATGAEALRGNVLGSRAKKQFEALRLLDRFNEALTLRQLAAEGIGAAVMKSLVSKGLAQACRKRILRDSYAGRKEILERFELTEEQRNAVEKISAAVNRGDGEKFLLQGITGSGKTEVYLRSAAEAVAAGKQVLMLVPEIALTAQLVSRFKSLFGDDIAVVHSKLSQNERSDVWYRMHTGQAKILIGVRSAVFAPFENLGLIIIDEEHETSYKQEERPNYNAVKVAECRGQLVGAPLVLGSATPDICTYYAAISGRITHLRLTARPNGAVLPDVEIVDMRQELQDKNFGVLSRRLQQALVKTAAEGEQAIVLLNRRGYSTFVMCRDCGSAVVCPHCAVAMVYHSSSELMRCHYCGAVAEIPRECPECHSKRIKFFGTGTQKAEEELSALPEVRVLRMDQDSTAGKFAHEEILQSFTAGKRNVLIGTQMVAKGHDIPNVTLVGVLSADSALNLPDFRAGERAFSILTQAAGRAGRGSKGGHVIFQAYDAENTILRLAAKQDYDTFAAGELQARKEYLYPPFVEMVKITVWDEDEDRGLALAERTAEYLRAKSAVGAAEDLKIIGPFPALVAKVRDMYRFNILLKAVDLSRVKEILLGSEFKEKKNISFDVDPVSVI